MHEPRRRNSLTLLREALAVVAEQWIVQHRPASVSGLARRLGTNYDTASRLVSMLVNAGALRPTGDDRYRVGGNAAVLYAIIDVIEHQLSLGGGSAVTVNEYLAEVGNILKAVKRGTGRTTRFRIEGPEEHIASSEMLLSFWSSGVGEKLVSLYYRAADYAITAYRMHGDILKVPVYILDEDFLAGVKVAFGIAFAVLSGMQVIFYDPRGVVKDDVEMSNVRIVRSADELYQAIRKTHARG